MTFDGDSHRAIAIVLSAPRARQFAAAVLNAADEADGTERLSSLTIPG